MSRSRSDGDALVSTNRAGTVALWNTATGESIGPRFQYHSDAVWRVAVTSDSLVITASEDGSVRSLDVLDVGRACEFGGGSLDRRRGSGTSAGARRWAAGTRRLLCGPAR